MSAGDHDVLRISNEPSLFFRLPTPEHVYHAHWLLIHNLDDSIGDEFPPPPPMGISGMGANRQDRIQQ